jgi:hypothetical protein
MLRVAVGRSDLALRLRVDVGVGETIQCRHTFQHTRHILRRYRCHENFRQGAAVCAGLREQPTNNEPQISTALMRTIPLMVLLSSLAFRCRGGTRRLHRPPIFS